MEAIFADVSKFDRLIDEIQASWAMEADSLRDKKDPTMSQSEQKSKNALSKSDKLDDLTKDKPKTPQDFIKEFENRVNAMKGKAKEVEDRIGKLIQSADAENQQFLKNIKTQEYKETEGPIEVTNWTYGHNPQRYLHQKVIKLKSVIDSNIRELRKDATALSDQSILEKTAADMEEIVVRQMGAPSAITSYKEFSLWLQTQFRGKKATRQLGSEMIQPCVSAMQDFSHSAATFKNDIGAVDNMLRAMSTQVRSQLNNTDIHDTMKQKLLKRVDRLNKLIVMYLSCIVLSYRLQTEYVLNRRAIMRRLYQK